MHAFGAPPTPYNPGEQMLEAQNLFAGTLTFIRKMTIKRHAVSILDFLPQAECRKVIR